MSSKHLRKHAARSDWSAGCASFELLASAPDVVSEAVAVRVTSPDEDLGLARRVNRAALDWRGGATPRPTAGERVAAEGAVGDARSGVGVTAKFLVR